MFLTFFEGLRLKAGAIARGLDVKVYTVSLAINNLYDLGTVMVLSPIGRPHVCTIIFYSKPVLDADLLMTSLDIMFT